MAEAIIVALAGIGAMSVALVAFFLWLVLRAFWRAFWPSFRDSWTEATNG